MCFLADICFHLNIPQQQQTEKNQSSSSFTLKKNHMLHRITRSLFSSIFQLAKRSIMADIVHWFVFLTVYLARVNKQIDCVHVMQAGWGTIAQKVGSI